MGSQRKKFELGLEELQVHWKLDNIWRSKNVEIKDKLLLMRSIVMATLLYACESWTVSKSDKQRLKTFEMKIYRRLLGISWKEKKTNLFVKNRIREICGYKPGVVERKFKYFGHRVCGGGTAKAVMEGGMEGTRERGRPQRNWMGNLKDWSDEGGVKLRADWQWIGTTGKRLSLIGCTHSLFG